MAILIALILMLTITIPLFALPTVDAETTRMTYSFIGATPNPVGVNQATLLHVGITLYLQDVAHGWEGLIVTITKPDGSVENLTDIRTDSIGGTGVTYVPTMTGNYTLQTHFPEQVTGPGKMGANTPSGTRMLASSSDKLTLIVTEEVQPRWPGVSLPTEYWTRPINAQNWEWASISGSWLTPLVYGELRYAPYNQGPESAHMLWARTVQTGGLVGGELGSLSYEDGAAYELKAYPAIIISGVLYFNKFEERGAPYAEQVVTAIDLKTGEELWTKPLIGRTGTTNGATVSAENMLIDGASAQFPDGIGRRLDRGQLFHWSSYNYQGAYGFLWTVTDNTWMAFDALTGRWVFTVTDVPEGTTMDGPKGEMYRYTQNLNNGWFALWNLSAIVSMAGSWNPHGNVYNASGVTDSGALAESNARAWTNITIPQGLQGSIKGVAIEDKVFAKVFGASTSTTAISSWAFSLKSGEEGRLLFNKTWNAPSDWATGDVSVSFSGVSFEDNVFVVSIQETRQHWGFSATTGNLLWTTEPQHYLDTYSMDIYDSPGIAADGRFFSGGVSGITYCYNITTGKLLWTHAMKDRYSEGTWGVNYPRAVQTGFVADGKYYSGYTEHSPEDPQPRGAPFVCIDVETGEELWSIYIPACNGGSGLTSPIGDSTIALFNEYDNRMYAIGKGPSAITVDAPDASIDSSKSVVIKGTVTDVSPGTMDYALATRFPNGVPAIADEYMSEWMQYVYMHLPRPSDAVGVEVQLYVIDANDNYRPIGNATSDASGFFSFDWQPDIPGKYTVIASFEGSNSYYPSSARTAFAVEAPEPTPEPTDAPLSMADLYFVPAVAGIIATIIVGFALIALLLKKRP
jgi:outer membrane protein assembly factor BamB